MKEPHHAGESRPWRLRLCKLLRMSHWKSWLWLAHGLRTYTEWKSDMSITPSQTVERRVDTDPYSTAEVQHTQQRLQTMVHFARERHSAANGHLHFAVFTRIVEDGGKFHLMAECCSVGQAAGDCPEDEGWKLFWSTESEGPATSCADDQTMTFDWAFNADNLAAGYQRRYLDCLDHLAALQRQVDSMVQPQPRDASGRWAKAN